jgi:hypothetical protein
VSPYPCPFPFLFFPHSAHRILSSPWVQTTTLLVFLDANLHMAESYCHIRNMSRYLFCIGPRLLPQGNTSIAHIQPSQAPSGHPVRHSLLGSENAGPRNAGRPFCLSRHTYSTKSDEEFSRLEKQRRQATHLHLSSDYPFPGSTPAAKAASALGSRPFMSRGVSTTTSSSHTINKFPHVPCTNV